MNGAVVAFHERTSVTRRVGQRSCLGTVLSNKALQSDSGAIDGALRALLFDAAAAERQR
jgi:hypothetical protein